ncbi:MAG TPA: gamma-glutamylcyclotransferase [Allocoleopsis sp.]
MDDLLRVFVYGTLKPGERYHDRYCGGRVISAQQAMVYGHLFHLPIQRYPALCDGNLAVYGFLLTFADPLVLNELDQLEGYSPHQLPEDNEYMRIQKETFSLNHQSLGTAWVYQMNLERAKRLGAIFLPEGLWTDRSS